MKKILFYLMITFVLATGALGQNKTVTEPEKYKTAAARFVSAYNKEDIKTICSLFTPELVKLLPQDRMDLLISVLKLQFGKTTGHKFIGFEQRNNKKVARYKASLERGKLDLLVSLDSSGKVDFIWFIPDDEKTKAAAQMLQQMFTPKQQ